MSKEENYYLFTHQMAKRQKTTAPVPQIRKKIGIKRYYSIIKQESWCVIFYIIVTRASPLLTILCSKLFFLCVFT